MAGMHSEVDAQPFNAGHRVDAVASRAAINDEYRPDQIIGAHRMFADQPPRPIRLSIAAQALPQVEGVWAEFDTRFNRHRPDSGSHGRYHGQCSSLAV
jgi:hypothetical protein